MSMEQVSGRDSTDKINKAIACPKGEIPLPDGRVILLSEWTPTVSLTTGVTVVLKGVIMVPEDDA